jgi:hypothetical protein
MGGLKQAVVEMFAELNMPSFQALFFPQVNIEASKQAPMEEKNQAENDGKSPGGASIFPKRMEGQGSADETHALRRQDELGWHPLFLRDLLARMFEKSISHDSHAGYNKRRGDALSNFRLSHGQRSLACYQGTCSHVAAWNSSRDNGGVERGTTRAFNQGVADPDLAPFFNGDDFVEGGVASDLRNSDSSVAGLWTFAG